MSFIVKLRLSRYAGAAQHAKLCEEFSMPASRNTNLLQSGGRSLKNWLAAGLAKALQLLLEGISARAQAITGTRPSKRLARWRSPNTASK